MTYTARNFKTKKALKEAVAAGEPVEIYEPGGWPVKRDGTVYLEGPHAPQPHSWYATATVKDGVVVKVK
jgi:hypothetical protein